MTLSANIVKMDAIDPAMIDASREPTKYQASMATRPPVATEPISLPNVARMKPPNTSTAMMMVNGSTEPVKLNESELDVCDGGAGKGSPSTTRMMRSTPAEIPPAKSPFLNFGVMISSMMRFEVTSVSAPSRPYPTSMRSLRSFLAMTRIAPSSVFLRPTFQASATRIEYCSMVSGAVVGTIRTAIWLPFRASKSFRVCANEAMSPLESVAVWSTTRPVSGGTATSARAAQAQHSSARKEALAAFIATNLVAGLFCRRWRRIEIHLRRCRNFLFILDREVRLLLVSERHGRQIGRERANRHIVVLHLLDVAIARHRDAVLGALKLRHQVTEQCVGFELRIILGHHQQSRQRAGELALGGLELLERGGIIQHLRRRLHAADLGAGVG